MEMDIFIKDIMTNFIGFLFIVYHDIANILTPKPRSIKAIV